MISYLYLVALCALLCPTISGRPDYNSLLRSVNNALTEATKSDDINENLVIAKKLLDKEKGIGLKTLFYSRDKDYAQVLEWVWSLNKIVDGYWKCDDKGVAILMKLNAGLGGEVCIVRSSIPKGRVESILYRIAFDHAIECQDVYRDKLIEADSKMGPTESSAIENLVELGLLTFYQRHLDETDTRRLDFSPVEAEGKGMFKEQRATEFLKHLSQRYDLVSKLQSDIRTEDKVELLIKAIDQPFHACYSLFHFYEPTIKDLMFDEKVLPLPPLVENPDEKEKLFRQVIMKYKICQEYIFSAFTLRQEAIPFVGSFK